MNNRNIVIIGAGSASFGPTTLATIINNPALRGSRLSLVDLDPQALDAATRVARRMSDAWEAEMTICASTDRRDVLMGATHVVVSIEVPPREELWRLDWEIPLRHGLRQPYGENGGPGGLMHACRQIPPHLAIARDMESYCSEAWMILFSNPLPRIARAISKYTSIKCVGKCHQINVGYALVAALLAGRYGTQVPHDVTLSSDPGNTAVVHNLAQAGRQHFSITSAGLNHFIWLADVHDKTTGEDLYPALREAAYHAPPSLEPLSLHLLRLFDRLPIAGDTHLSEYLPWLHDPIANPWERYQLPLYDWSGNESVREVLHVMMRSMADGSLAVDGMREAASEGAAELIAALGGGGTFIDETVNVPNRGAIAGLPYDTIVEAPAMVNSSGIHPLHIHPFPAPIVELWRREAGLVEMVVDTAVTGDRALALQTLALDPMINALDRAEAILDDYLAAFENYLPQFN